MRLLLNMNLPRALAAGLSDFGHECRHAGEIGLAEADDSDIIDTARASGEVILTHDLDYGLLLAFSGQSSPSVVILRLRNMSVSRAVARLLEVLNAAAEALHKGAVVVVDEATTRIRRLPIRE